MKFHLCICLLVLSAVIFGQKRYKFSYDIHLKNIPSTYTIKYDSINDGYTKIIAIAEGNDTLPDFSVKIQGTGLDTVFRTSYRYIETIHKIALKPGQYKISILDIQSTPLMIEKTEIYTGRSATIIAKMGYRNDLKLGSIHSKRKLTQPEIEKIINDYSNRLEPELIKNKTCVVSWEI